MWLIAETPEGNYLDYWLSGIASERRSFGIKLLVPNDDMRLLEVLKAALNAANVRPEKYLP